MKKIIIITAALIAAVSLEATAQRRQSQTANEERKTVRSDRNTNKRNYAEKETQPTPSTISREKSTVTSTYDSRGRTSSAGNSTRNRTSTYREPAKNRTTVNRERTTTRTATTISRETNEQRRNTGSRNYYNKRERGNANVQHKRVYDVKRETRAVKHHPTSRIYVNRHEIKYHHVTRPKPIRYRSVYHPYREPVHVHLVWTPAVYREYCVMYPEIREWKYRHRYSVHTVSAYDAMYHVGEIRRVYGKVYDTYYVPDTDEYFLYIGARYPYHDFSIVLPGYIARKYSRRPQRYFFLEHVAVTGLISTFEGIPEVVVKRNSQIRVY
ncbi:MAG: hypothetical protein ACOCYF_01775 [Bacteroidota bacterium]